MLKLSGLLHGRTAALLVTGSSTNAVPRDATLMPLAGRPHERLKTPAAVFCAAKLLCS